MIENHFTMNAVKVVSYVLLTLLAVCCVVPFIIIISASFSTDSQLYLNGYKIYPQMFTLEAYRVTFQNSNQLLKAYGVTIFTTVVGGALSILITSMAAYPLSRPDYKWRRQISFFFYFTMLFSGGAIPSYILISQYLHLRNNILVLIIPALVNVWNIFLLRTYFSEVSMSLIEAAKIDGASEIYIYFNVVIPIAKTGIAIVLYTIVLAYWNSWYNCLMYMTNEKIINLQYFLYRTMSNIDEILKNAQSGSAAQVDVSKLPSETVRMAMCVIAAGPMVFAFMFFQKYFVKGIAVGSVKG